MVTTGKSGWRSKLLPGREAAAGTEVTNVTVLPRTDQRGSGEALR